MDMPKFPPILAIDFDGTIVTHAYPEIGELQKNAVEAIRNLHAKGYYIIIWTCRFGQHQDNVERFLQSHGIPYDEINEHHPDVRDFYKNDTRKISADIYIDDRQLGGLPDDWFTIERLVDETWDDIQLSKRK